MSSTKTVKPKISVIMPVYNMAKLIRRALDSLVAQSYCDYEIIIVDDGSTDESPSICDEYAAKYPCVRVIHKPNGGVSSARNIGMDAASGEWVTFCDSDDLPFKDWLANYDVDNVQDADLICQGFKTDKKVFGLHRDQNEVGFEYDGGAEGLTELLLTHNAIGYAWCKLYKLNIIKENNLQFDINIKLREDELFLYFYLSHVVRAISYNRKGYFYFMPNWGNKYGYSFEADNYLNEQVGKAIAKLMRFGEFRCLQNYHIDSMTYELMLEFSNTHKRIYLEKIRELLVKFPHSTRMTSYLKKIIVMDHTLTFSWIALGIHMKIKSILKK